jgi:hypothetical protein
VASTRNATGGLNVSTLPAIRSVLLGQHHGDDRLAVVAGSTQGLEADQRRLCSPSTFASIRWKRSFHLFRNSTVLMLHPPVRTHHRECHKRLVKIIQSWK